MTNERQNTHDDIPIIAGNNGKFCHQHPNELSSVMSGKQPERQACDPFHHARNGITTEKGLTRRSRTEMLNRIFSEGLSMLKTTENEAMTRLLIGMLDRV